MGPLSDLMFRIGAGYDRKRAHAAPSLHFVTIIELQRVMTEITRAQTLHQGQFTRLIKITQATSRYPERDVLVLMVGNHFGMRFT